jgi:hypothetical protein
VVAAGEKMFYDNSNWLDLQTKFNQNAMQATYSMPRILGLFWS